LIGKRVDLSTLGLNTYKEAVCKGFEPNRGKFPIPSEPRKDRTTAFLNIHCLNEYLKTQRLNGVSEKVIGDTHGPSLKAIERVINFRGDFR